MLRPLKTMLRDAVPDGLQVPAKYWFSALRGHLEPEMALLPWLVKEDSRVADVGGNRGVYAYQLHRLGALVEVFEPNPICAESVAAWARSLSNVEVHTVALSAQEGTATLHVPVDAHGVEHDSSASIEQLHRGTTRDLAVPVRTLDSYGFRDLALIKIDTEGHERSVVAGAAATLKACAPALLIEIEQRHNGDVPISSFFASIVLQGYSGFFLKGGRLLSIDTFDVNRDQSERAFAARDGTYVNNFIFLANGKIEAGHYETLVARWMPR